MQITYPITYFPSNWNILSFFTTFRFDSFHFILFCASWVLSCEFTLSKGKTSRKRRVYNHGKLYLFRFTYAYMQITVHLPNFAGDKNVDFEFPDACLFGHPFYFGYQDLKSDPSDFSCQRFNARKLWEMLQLIKVMQHALRPHNLIFLLSFFLLLSPKK